MASCSQSSLWAGGKTMMECLDYLHTSGFGSDVTFLVGKNRTRLHAHKMLLCCRSPVFFVMFEGLLAEKDEVIISDITPEIFLLFLRYMYTDKIVLTEENAGPLFNVARKYWIEVLTSACEEYLLDKVNGTNACMLLEQAIIFMIDSLRVQCLEVIIQEYLSVNTLPDIQYDLYPNTRRIYLEYAKDVGKARSKYRTLLTWLKDERRENKKIQETVISLPEEKHDGKNTLLECLDDMSMNCSKSDVKFTVGKHSEEIHAHRLILTSRSPVFYAMFKDQLVSKGNITLPDISPRDFRLFLRYVYTDNICPRARDAVAVYRLSRMYYVGSCFKAILRNINSSNVCSYLDQAHIFSCWGLRRTCLRLIAKYPIDVLRSRSFGNLYPDCMASVAESDSMRGVTEWVVYEAVVNWTEKECIRQGLQVTSSNKRRVWLARMNYLISLCTDGIIPDEATNPLPNYQHVPMDDILSKFNVSPGRNKRWAVCF